MPSIASGFDRGTSDRHPFELAASLIRRVQDPRFGHHGKIDSNIVASRELRVRIGTSPVGRRIHLHESVRACAIVGGSRN